MIHFRPSHWWTLLSALSLLLLNPLPSRGALLIYEGFTGYSGTLSGVAPNGNTVGLDTGLNYGGSGAGLYTVTGTGLSFGDNFLVSGGALNTNGGTRVAAARISVASPYAGTLWSSYLVNIASNGSMSGDGAHMRLAGDTSTTNARFNSFSDSRNGESNTVAVAYDHTIANGSGTLALNTTYLMLGQFTGVGSTGGGANSSGTATVYALSLAQYESFLASGATLAYLNSATVGSGSSQITGRGTETATTNGALATGSYAHFVSVGNNTTFDEMRWGSTLDSVIPVPEPGAAALLALGGLATLFHRRRR